MRAVSSPISRNRKWQAPRILKPSANKLLQFRTHSRRDLHLVTTEPPGDIDGLPVGAQELNAGWTIATMFVEPVLYLRLERSLHIFEQQPFDIAAPEH